QPEYRRWIPGMYANLAIVVAESGRPDEAEKYLRQAIALFQKMISDFPGTHRFQVDLAAAHNNLGYLMVRTNQIEKATVVYRLPMFMGGLSTCLWWYGMVDTHPAPEDARKAVELARGLVTRDPKGAGYWRALGLAQYRAQNFKESVASIENAFNLPRGSAAV